jgi:hypothetical protein
MGTFSAMQGGGGWELFTAAGGGCEHMHPQALFMGYVISRISVAW